MTMTTEKQVRAAFWRDHPGLDRGSQRIYFEGADQCIVRSKYRTHNDYPAEIRTAFVDYVDALQKSGEISEALAARVTL